MAEHTVYLRKRHRAVLDAIRRIPAAAAGALRAKMKRSTNGIVRQSFVWAIAVFANGEIAIHAEDAKSSGKIVFDKPSVNVASLKCCPMFSATTFDMINGQELKKRFSATSTATTVPGYCFVLQTAAIPTHSSLAQSWIFLMADHQIFLGFDAALRAALATLLTWLFSAHHAKTRCQSGIATFSASCTENRMASETAVALAVFWLVAICTSVSSFSSGSLATMNVFVDDFGTYRTSGMPPGYSPRIAMKILSSLDLMATRAT